MSVLHARVTKVWLALIVLTVITTWGLAKGMFGPAVAVTGILLIAALKVRLVMLDFMELRDAPVPVRIIFQGWILVVVTMILVFWFLTPSVR
ncbi:cytochrome C oxidase subunit IV family protein [Mycolicibacterium septicum]|uniref:cytochrome C oxidase subunit IV family protein n=1 Tax=Mycolicibacterium septicum TaxID=98668 RepID=UPI00236314A9|nr:cytochrome C oxidase subunit IV family protein [Mycolicibacterium septicum]